MEKEMSFMQFCQQPELIEFDCIEQGQMIAIFGSLMKEIGNEELESDYDRSARSLRFYDV